MKLWVRFGDKVVLAMMLVTLAVIMTTKIHELDVEFRYLSESPDYRDMNAPIPPVSDVAFERVSPVDSERNWQPGYGTSLFDPNAFVYADDCSPYILHLTTRVNPFGDFHCPTPRRVNENVDSLIVTAKLAETVSHVPLGVRFNYLDAEPTGDVRDWRIGIDVQTATGKWVSQVVRVGDRIRGRRLRISEVKYRVVSVVDGGVLRREDESTLIVRPPAGAPLSVRVGHELTMARTKTYLRYEHDGAMHQEPVQSGGILSLLGIGGKTEKYQVTGVHAGAIVVARLDTGTQFRVTPRGTTEIR